MGGGDLNHFTFQYCTRNIYHICKTPRGGAEYILYLHPPPWAGGGWQDMQYITYAIGIIVKSHEILVALTYNGTRRKKEDI